MSNNKDRPTSQHVQSTASYGAIGMSKKAVDQMSSSGKAVKDKRKALRAAAKTQELKNTNEGKSAQGK